MSVLDGEAYKTVGWRVNVGWKLRRRYVRRLHISRARNLQAANGALKDLPRVGKDTVRRDAVLCGGSLGKLEDLFEGLYLTGATPVAFAAPEKSDMNNAAGKRIIPCGISTMR